MARSAPAHEAARHFRDTLRRARRSEARANFRQSSEHLTSLRCVLVEQRLQGIGDSSRNYLILNELARDLSAGNDVHQSDVRDLHQPLLELETDAAHPVRIVERAASRCQLA